MVLVANFHIIGTKFTVGGWDPLGPPQAFSMLDERWRTLLLRGFLGGNNHRDDFAVPTMINHGSRSKVAIEHNLT